MIAIHIKAENENKLDSKNDGIYEISNIGCFCLCRIVVISNLLLTLKMNLSIAYHLWIIEIHFLFY